MIFRRDLERFLERGDELGFSFSPENSNYHGWILLRKQKVDERYLSLLEPGEDPIFVQKQKIIEKKPYLIQKIELERAKHDKACYMEEYDVHDIYEFHDLDEVQLFLNKYDKKLEEIKWSIEIDAP